MRYGDRWIATIAVALLVSAGQGSPADVPRGAREVSAAAAFGARQRLLVLLRDPAVRKELQLSPDQAQKLDAALAEVDGPLWRLRDVTPEQAKEESRRLVDQACSSAQELLSGEQRRRWAELQVRADGPRALVENSVVKKLAITPGLEERIRKLLSDAKRDGDAEKQAFALLSARQRQEFARLVGTPFDFAPIKRRAGRGPELQAVDSWINSEPLTLERLRGKVVVLHFWTHGCINCIRNLPHYKQWHDLFGQRGLVVIGIHTPETQGEHDPNAVRDAVRRFGIEYPVAIDNSKTVWKTWSNRIWPSLYVIDRGGYIRYWWYGELDSPEVDGAYFFTARLDELLAERD